MNTKQKEYIEQYIELIEYKKWESFFASAPGGTGAVLYAADIDFISDMRTVPAGCFLNSNINSITIPSGVTSIGVRAFEHCTSLTSVTIPSSVTSIGLGAFFGCSSLTSVTIPEGVTVIHNFTFDRCTSLTNVSIPESVRLIGGWVCAACENLKSVTIPKGVISIGPEAFNDCASLETVNFKGTVEQWSKIILSEESFKNILAQTVICSDGVIDIT